MSLLMLRLLVFVEAGVILFFILRLSARERPSVALRALSAICVLAGAVLVYKSHMDYGWRGPLGFLDFIPRRIRFITVTLHERVNYWSFLDPSYYGGAFGLCLLAGGAGLMRLRRWARTLLQWSTGLLAAMALVHLMSFNSRLGFPGIVLDLALLVFALGCLACFRIPGILVQFPPGNSPPAASAPP